MKTAEGKTKLFLSQMLTEMKKYQTDLKIHQT